MITHLTKDFIKIITTQRETIKAYLQLLSYQEIDGREEVELSDGISKAKFMIFSRMTETDKQILKNGKYLIIHCEVSYHKNINLILSFDVKVNCNKLIGNPIDYSSYKDMNYTNTNGSNMIPMEFITSDDNVNNNSNNVEVPDSMLNNPENYTQIKALTMHDNNVVIRARVIKKSEIKEYSNTFKKTSGRYFSVELLDKSGVINGTFFNDSIDKFHSIITEGLIYSFTNFEIKASKYAHDKNKLNIYFNVNSTIDKLPNRNDIPMYNYNFNKIIEIKNKDINSMIDLIAVVTEDESVTQVSLKNGETKIKKVVKIIDDSNEAIELVIWGTDANKYTFKQRDIILVSSIKLGEFNHVKQLIFNFTTKITKEIPETHRYTQLIEWIRNNNANNVDYVTNSNNNSLSNTKILEFSSINDMINDFDSNSNFGESRPMYYNVIGYINFIKDTYYYNSCINDECRKKVIKNGDKYECLKCNILYDRCKPRFIPTYRISDSTGHVYASCLDNVSNEKIFGKSCEGMVEFEEKESKETVMQYLKSKYFTQYKFNIKVFHNQYNGETTTKFVIQSLSQITPWYVNNQSESLLNYLRK